LHVVELIEENLNRINFGEFEGEVVVHDPPFLSIGLNKGEIIARILSKIKGIKIKKPIRFGENTFYCGVFNVLKWLDEKLLREINLVRLRELVEEADIIITASPSSKRGLEEVGGKYIYDIIEFLFEVGVGE